MNKSTIKPAKGSTAKRKRRGRGNASGLGGESGRGHKGQKSRSGYSAQGGFEGGQMPLYRRLPKKRGLGNAKQTYFHPINLSQLNEFFENNSEVTPEILLEKKLIARNEKVKILGNGELSKKLTIKAHKISESALQKLTASTSTFEQIN